ncbi:MAG: rubrerythrin family protein, partial [Phaeodactylibacter sp.]|nr:rubrerythrin family protein [Phaeodactylibacter sp.]
MYDIKKRLQQLQTEVDTAYLYQRFAALEEDESVAQVFRELSAVERSHAEHLLLALSKVQSPPPKMPGPSRRARVQAGIARVMGYSYVLPTVLDTEKSLANSALLSRRESGQPASGA